MPPWSQGALTPLWVIYVLILPKAPTIHGRDVSDQLSAYHPAPQTSRSIPDVYSHVSLSNWQTTTLPPGSMPHTVGACGISDNVTLTILFIHSCIVKFLPALQPFRHNHPLHHSGTLCPLLLLPQRSKKRGRRKHCSRRRFVRFLIA